MPAPRRAILICEANVLLRQSLVVWAQGRRLKVTAVDSHAAATAAAVTTRFDFGIIRVGMAGEDCNRLLTILVASDPPPRLALVGIERRGYVVPAGATSLVEPYLTPELEQALGL